MTITRSTKTTPYWASFIFVPALCLAISSYGRYRVHAHATKYSEAEKVITTCMATDATERMTFEYPTNPLAMAMICCIDNEKISVSQRYSLLLKEIFGNPTYS